MVEAFLAASRGGDFEALLTLLDPDVGPAGRPGGGADGASSEVRGAAAVAGTLSGRARAARPALVGGEVGLVWASGGRPRVAFVFTIEGGRIARIDLVADPERLVALRPTPLERLSPPV